MPAKKNADYQKCEQLKEVLGRTTPVRKIGQPKNANAKRIIGHSSQACGCRSFLTSLAQARVKKTNTKTLQEAPPLVQRLFIFPQKKNHVQQIIIEI